MQVNAVIRERERERERDSASVSDVFKAASLAKLKLTASRTSQRNVMWLF